MRWSLGVLVRLGLVGSLLALVAPGPAMGGSDDPDAVTGTRRGPVGLTSSLDLVGRLDLPAGRWLVFAHVHAFIDSDIIPPFPTAECRLAVGSSRQWSRFELIDGVPAPTLVTVGSIDTGGGEARLRCREVDRDSTVSSIQMTALRIGRSTSVPLAGGAATTEGSGLPAVRIGDRDEAVGVPFSRAYGSVGRLSLPKGRWLVLASLGLWGVDHQAATASCRLTTGGGLQPLATVDRATSSLLSRRWPLFLLSAVRADVPTTLGLGCRAGIGGVTARDARVVAIKVGSLTTTLLPSGQTQVTGTRAPVAVVGLREQAITVPLDPGAAMAGVTVTAGPWLVLGKLDLVGTEDPDGVFMVTAHCSIPGRLKRAATTLGSVLMPGWGSGSMVGAMPMAAGTASLRCFTNPFGGGYPLHTAVRVRLAALRAGSLTTDALDS